VQQQQQQQDNNMWSAASSYMAVIQTFLQATLIFGARAAINRQNTAAIAHRAAKSITKGQNVHTAVLQVLLLHMLLQLPSAASSCVHTPVIAVQAHVQNAGIGLKDVLRAVAMVHLQADSRNRVQQHTQTTSNLLLTQRRRGVYNCYMAAMRCIEHILFSLIQLHALLLLLVAAAATLEHSTQNKQQPQLLLPFTVMPAMPPACCCNVVQATAAARQQPEATHVPVKDQHTLRASRLRCTRRHCCIVEEAKAHRSVALRMVPWWPDDGCSTRCLTTHHTHCCICCTACCQRRAVQRVLVDVSVRWDDSGGHCA
jgi:hypothetical protein